MVACPKENFKNVYALLTQSRTYWRTRVSHTSCNLQLDIGLYFLSHYKFLKLGNNASERLPVI